MSEVHLDSVSKTFANGVRALDRLNLTVSDGERLVIVGPSGSGKSTTLRLIAGLESLSSGEIRLAGESVGHLSPVDRDVAMVFQMDTLYPHLTVSQNLAFGLKMRGGAADEVQTSVDAMAQMLEIGSLLSRFPHELSGGQRQRVALGRALVRQPRVFLLDEPLASLDVRLRLQMRTEILRIQRQLGTTMIYVTHDQQEAMTLGDRIVVICDGVAQQTGPPNEVYSQPANAFVASFIGSPGMSFLTAKVSGGRAAVQAAEIGIETPVRDGKVLLGIRPEDLQLGETSGCDLQAIVTAIDDLGYERLVHLSIGSESLIARTSSGGWKTGDKIGISMRRAAIRFFDTENDRSRLA